MRAARTWIAATVFAGALALTPALLGAQTKPANATAECKDGTFSTAKSKRGACSGHGGIKTWYADEGNSAKADAKAAGKETKSAAKEAGSATKDAAKAVGKETKEVAKDTASGTKSAAKAVGKATESAANAIKPKPSDAPQDATAKCKDGSYSHAKQHRGACSGHGGVAEWYK
jgi:uncharacterized protein DUF3761